MGWECRQRHFQAGRAPACLLGCGLVAPHLQATPRCAQACTQPPSRRARSLAHLELLQRVESQGVAPPVFRTAVVNVHLRLGGKGGGTVHQALLLSTAPLRALGELQLHSDRRVACSASPAIATRNTHPWACTQGPAAICNATLTLMAGDRPLETACFKQVVSRLVNSSTSPCVTGEAVRRRRKEGDGDRQAVEGCRTLLHAPASCSNAVPAWHVPSPSPVSGLRW